MAEADPIRKLLKLKELNVQGYSTKLVEMAAASLLQEKRGDRAEVSIFGGKSFLDVEDEAEQFLIPGFIPAGGSAMLSGQPGANKTFLALQMALAVSNGRDFLGSPISKPGKVLILATDQPARITRSYMRAMASPEDWENVIIIAPDPKNKQKGWTVKDMAKLELAIEQYQPVLTIADSIHRIICEPMGIDPKDATTITYWMGAVQSLATRTGSLLWVHHDGKSKEHQGIERSLGSVQIPGSVDVVMRLEKVAPGDPANPQRILSLDKTRGFEGSRLRLDFNSETCCLDLIGEAGQSEELAASAQNQTQQIIQFLVGNRRENNGTPVGFEPIGN